MHFRANPGNDAYAPILGFVFQANLTVLQWSATSNFADIYGWRDIGRIEPGRVADVLILDADPRSDLAALDHIDRIIFRGVVLYRQSLLEARDMK
jgi:cytosine/adenosine deaminase-related metal-dependent hydrolase